MLKKLVVFTVNTNNYDRVEWDIDLIKKCKKNNIPIFYFTDDRNANAPKGVLIKLISTDEARNDLKKDRKIKILPHKFLPPHDYSIYLDARIIIKPNIIDKMIKYFSLGYDWISFKHRHRTSATIETIIATIYSKMTLISGIKTIAELNKVNYRSKKTELSENGCIGRKNNAKVQIACEKWASYTRDLKCRDQPSLVIALASIKPELKIKRYMDEAMSAQKDIIINNRFIKSITRKKFLKLWKSIYTWLILLSWDTVTRIWYKLRRVNSI